METTTNPKILAHAETAANKLYFGRVSIEAVEPGDFTRYLMVITPVPVDRRREVGASHILALPNFGTVYPVNIGQMDASYAAEKWGNGNLCTGGVVADYISAVAAVLHGAAPAAIDTRSGYTTVSDLLAHLDLVPEGESGDEVELELLRDLRDVVAAGRK